jgi:hypothetical protein
MRSLQRTVDTAFQEVRGALPRRPGPFGTGVANIVRALELESVIAEQVAVMEMMFVWKRTMAAKKTLAARMKMMVLKKS